VHQVGFIYKVVCVWLNFKSSWVFLPCHLYAKDILQDGILKAYELTGLDCGIP